MGEPRLLLCLCTPTLPYLMAAACTLLLFLLLPLAFGSLAPTALLLSALAAVASTVFLPCCCAFLPSFCGFRSALAGLLLPEVAGRRSPLSKKAMDV